MNHGLKTLADCPTSCPSCDDEHLLKSHVSNSDKQSVVKCVNADCDSKTVFKSDVACVELNNDEHTCHSYDCHGRLAFIKPKLYYCQECGRFAGIATTSRGVGYPTSKCPICLTKSPTNIDFHHWNYKNDTGVHICRSCHNQIHDGMRAREQTAESPSGESWKVTASNNLVCLHEKHHGPVESWDYIFDLYNLPDEPQYDHLRDLKQLPAETPTTCDD